MDTRDHSVEIGTHSPSLGTPIIQMGALLHPMEMEHRSRAVDITNAISAMQAETALLRAEVITLKVALVTELEHVAQLRLQLHRDLTSLEASFHTESDSLLAEVHRVMAQNRRERAITEGLIDDIYQATIETHAMIRDIPETYWTARVARFLRHLVRR